tara:strand:+ start:69 stop:659 length:591 start_codon:yes stop_codon:yes gene_type:complete
MIDQLLEEIGEDKTQNMTTTSLKFKRDVWEFFQGFEDKTAVEFGTHKGQTTKILSHLFKKVYTVNNQDNAEAKRLNEDIQNIEYISNFDLYLDNPLPITNIDVFLIDAGHKYNHVISDINRAVSMECNKECYIIFDDYGLKCHSEHVKRAVDQAINQNILTKVKGIGHSKGYSFKQEDPEYTLEASEGLITKINWS